MDTSTDQLIKDKYYQVQKLTQEINELIEKQNTTGNTAKDAYELEKDEMVQYCVNQVTVLAEIAKGVEFDVQAKMQDYITNLLHYAKMTGKSHKGNFTIIHSNQLSKVQTVEAEQFQFDERGTLAAKKVKSWLAGLVKNEGNKIIYELVSEIIQTKDNKLDPKQINKLYKYESEIQDADFQEAIKLFKESYHSIGIKSYMRIYSRPDANAAWQHIDVKFGK